MDWPEWRLQIAQELDSCSCSLQEAAGTARRAMDAKMRCAGLSFSSVSVIANALRYRDDQRVISAMIKAGGIAPRA